MSSLLRPFEEQLGRSRAVDANGNAIVRFENEHSLEAVRVDGKQMKQLLQNMKDGAQSLAFGAREKAQEQLQPIYDLSGPQRDYFQRDPRRAQVLFDACTSTAYFLARDKQPKEGESYMERCVRTFPGYEAQQPMRKMFERALAKVALEPHGTLSIEGGRSDCTTRVNGIAADKSSSVDIATGARRVQIECGEDTLGRIHVVVVHEGENHVVIDPTFDAAVRTEGALWLSYPNESARQARMRVDAATLEKVLGSHVVLLGVEELESGESKVYVSSVDGRDLATLKLASGAGYRAQDVQAAVQAVLATTTAAAPEKRMVEPVLVQARLEPELDQRPSPRTTEMDPALRLGLGVTLGAVGVAGLSVSWVMYVHRFSLRTRFYFGMVDDAALHEFDRAGGWVIGAAAIGSAFLASAGVFLLPETDSPLPTGAWVAGGVGAALALTGLGFAVFGQHCRPQLASDGRCGDFTSDSTFAPLLALHAIPLLSVPTTYALRQWFGPQRVEIGFDGRLLSLAGVF
jgi:hypothetical protein